MTMARDTHSHADPVDALLALNMGDFVTDHLISDALLEQIDHAVQADPSKLKQQLAELLDIYSLQNTLGLLGLDGGQAAVLYDAIAESLCEMLQVERCHVFHLNDADGFSAFVLAGSATPSLAKQVHQYQLSWAEAAPFIKEALDEGLPTVYKSALEHYTPLDAFMPTAAIAAPLFKGQKPWGLLLLESDSLTKFSDETLDLVEAVAHLFSVSHSLQGLLDHAEFLIKQTNPDLGRLKSLRAQLTEAIGDLGRYQQFFAESLAMAIDARNAYTQGHSQGVAHIAKQLAETMELSEKTVDLIYYAGLLCGLGKFHLPKELLEKEAQLSPAEWQAIKQSPNLGIGLLMRMNFLAEVIPYVNFQKERWDGTDSPNGLSGRDIPVGARIVAVADAYHALTHARPYRKDPMSQADALTVLQSEAGSKWDPFVVEQLAKMLSASAA